MRRLRKKNAALSALATKDGGGPDGVLVPEIFSPAVARALPQLFAASPGPRVALFHDAIALQHPEFTPRGTVARFPAYLQELLQFDGIAAVSEASRQSLLDYWSWLGVSRLPEVKAIPLGLDPPAAAPAPAPAGEPTILCVGSIEARKNHVALLEACEALWARGLKFRLHLVGLAHAETGGPAVKRIAALKGAGRSLRYDGPADERALEESYGGASFTVYPSLAEGYGLPVAESLSRGLPCLCRFEGALGEIARGGGCIDLADAGPRAIAAAIEELLFSAGRLAALSEAARSRRFRTWPEYVDDLLPWMKSLGRHA